MLFYAIPKCDNLQSSGIVEDLYVQGCPGCSVHSSRLLQTNALIAHECLETVLWLQDRLEETMGASQVVFQGEDIAVVDRIVSAATVADIKVVEPLVTCLFEDVTFFYKEGFVVSHKVGAHTDDLLLMLKQMLCLWILSTAERRSFSLFFEVLVVHHFFLSHHLS